MTRRSLAWLVCAVALSGEATSSSLLDKEGASLFRSDGDVASPLVSSPLVVAGVSPPAAATSEPITLDIESGVRQTAGAEHLAYDVAWVVEVSNGVTFKVSVNGAEKAQVGACAVTPRKWTDRCSRASIDR